MKQRAKDGGHFSPNRSFFPSSEDALCIFDLRIPQLVMDAGGALNMHFGFGRRVTFVVHRHALVDLVKMYTKAEGESEIIDTAQASPSTGDILPGPLSAGAQLLKLMSAVPTERKNKRATYRMSDQSRP
jgi:hypothetical protein